MLAEFPQVERWYNTLFERPAAKRGLEERIEELKYRKAGMDTAQYALELENMLLQLSRTQLRLDDLERQ